MLTICNKLLIPKPTQLKSLCSYPKYFGILSLELKDKKITRKPLVKSQQNELLRGKYLPSHDLFRQFKTTEMYQSISKDFNTPRKSIFAPWFLGISGLIPFVTPPLLMYTQNVTCPELMQYQLYYGAAILSFLGGVRWGMAVTPGSAIPGNLAQYSWSVIPSLIAWGALMLPDTYPVMSSVMSPGMSFVIFGIALTCYKDLKQAGYPLWFKGLRILLTIVAIISMSSSLYIMYNNESKKPLPDILLTSQIQLEEMKKEIMSKLEDSARLKHENEKEGTKLEELKHDLLVKLEETEPFKVETVEASTEKMETSEELESEELKKSPDDATTDKIENP